MTGFSSTTSSTRDPLINKLGFESWCLQLPVWYWPTHLALVNLSLLIHKVIMTIIITINTKQK